MISVGFVIETRLHEHMNLISFVFIICLLVLTFLELTIFEYSHACRDGREMAIKCCCFPLIVFNTKNEIEMNKEENVA